MRRDPAPRRIVSLVPSLTEALFALDLGDRVVGVTEFCEEPAREVASLPRVGGTKNADPQRVLALAPDLVLANHEENTRSVVERLRAAGLWVWVTYPRTVRQAAQLLHELAALGAPPQARRKVLDPLDTAVADAQRNLPARGARVFCPVWRDPWMSVGVDTYGHDVLHLCGGENVFAARRDRRYPIVRREEIEAAEPEVILLPDEPYRFGAEDAAALARLDIPAARAGRIHLIDGKWVSWYGPRIPVALRALRPLLRPASCTGGASGATGGAAGSEEGAACP